MIIPINAIGFAAARSHGQLAAENLFLRKQLALYVERQVKPRRADDATRIALVALSRLIDRRGVLTIVKPDTLVRWHRKGFQALYASPTGLGAGTGSQFCSTFVRNHANAVLACDFFVMITASFRVLYVFVVLEVGTRRIRHWNVTEHRQPTGRRSSPHGDLGRRDASIRDPRSRQHLL